MTSVFRWEGMKYTTVVRLISDCFFWHVPSDCHVQGHETYCNCEVPKNWIFVDEVHDTYKRLAEDKGYYPYYYY